jgi:hypothetical protein
VLLETTLLELEAMLLEAIDNPKEFSIGIDENDGLICVVSDVVRAIVAVDEVLEVAVDEVLKEIVDVIVRVSVGVSEAVPLWVALFQLGELVSDSVVDGEAVVEGLADLLWESVDGGVRVRLSDAVTVIEPE